MTQLATELERAVRVVVAPDSFKGTHRADEVATSVASGLRSAGVLPIIKPLADGGEGTLWVLQQAYAGTIHQLPVTGPDGALRMGSILCSASGRTVVVETASASGLTLIDPDQYDPWGATSRGTGELIAAAAALGPERIQLGVGGSATTDGGRGAIDAILESGGLRGSRLEILCDVTTPFERAAVVFSPQKGADPDTVLKLTRRLHDLARDFPRDPRGRPRTGCAGGLSGGLWAQFGAELRSGIDEVLAAVDFTAAVQGAHSVVTGEGRLDGQTSAGKVIAGVIAACRAPKVAVHAVVGQSLVSEDDASKLGLESVRIASTREDLVQAGYRIGVQLMDRLGT